MFIKYLSSTLYIRNYDRHMNGACTNFYLCFKLQFTCGGSWFVISPHITSHGIEASLQGN